MPIGAATARRYPKDWKRIAAAIRERAGGRCECIGQCGLHHKRRCEERDREPAKWARGMVVLTVAHLDHTPEHVEDSNLLAMCNRCHLRYDVSHHQANAKETRLRKKGERQRVIF